MIFHATGTTNDFRIHIADAQAAKPGEDPGTRAGEPVTSLTCIDAEGDHKVYDFYSSDALNAQEILDLKALLDKLSAHAIQTLS